MRREQHVRHLLVRCITDQLPPQKLARVRAHVAVCASCRAALAQQEYLASGIIQAGKSFEQPAPHLVMDWWNVIQMQRWARRPRQRKSAIMSLLAPLVVSLLLLIGVLATEVSSTHAVVSSTYGSPAIDTTLEPTSRAYPNSFGNLTHPDSTATPDSSAIDLSIPTAPLPGTD
jgi:predicted anti-sigma-YlaC factor YlaD